MQRTPAWYPVVVSPYCPETTTGYPLPTLPDWAGSKR
jgi:hypothetical protein